MPHFVLLRLHKIFTEAGYPPSFFRNTNRRKGGKLLGLLLARISNLLATVDFAPVIEPILEVLNAILWPAIAIVGAVGTIYCIVLGIKLAKSDEQNSREKAKKDLIGAVVGFVIIFVLIVALKIALPILQEWVQSQIK